MCVKIHQIVDRKCVQFKAELSRHNYVTPKSYLELLNIFSKLTSLKKNELCTARQRMKMGLDKASFWNTELKSALSQCIVFI